LTENPEENDAVFRFGLYLRKETIDGDEDTVPIGRVGMLGDERAEEREEPVDEGREEEKEEEKEEGFDGEEERKEEEEGDTLRGVDRGIGWPKRGFETTRRALGEDMDERFCPYKGFMTTLTESPRVTGGT
jgi:hypothetical protein